MKLPPLPEPVPLWYDTTKRVFTNAQMQAHGEACTKAAFRLVTEMLEALADEVARTSRYPHDYEDGMRDTAKQMAELIRSIRMPSE